MDRVDVMQCYRCWGYGHTRRACKEEIGKENTCRRCGRAGHLQKECKEEAQCLSCGNGGHIVESGKCPEFQKALRRARQQQRKTIISHKLQKTLVSAYNIVAKDKHAKKEHLHSRCITYPHFKTLALKNKSIHYSVLKMLTFHKTLISFDIVSLFINISSLDLVETM
ncbi:hypothetical protein NQ315_013971 [Exocentrus adspersus]|uniref:CCHC-type domain-containing protein n=1 Tax=Exocentrus adspersus TaxID=1586481 RepID=A0AAV8VSS7_9CUCU|nr:hypothetical protein NQ315_013971 [Exocentrus adspersus]